jgi:TolB-like protein/tetratricopeptide (TPR) repeat protein
MSGPIDRAEWVRFGIYEVNVAERILLRKGIRLRLQNKPFAILILLLERACEIVTHEELRQKLWPDGTYVNFEHGMAVALHKLRTALDDNAESPRFIETVSGYGYRFLLPVGRPATTETRPPSRALLVVLPLVALTTDPNIIPLADGFTEELTTQLSKVMPRHLGVIGRTTAMSYRDTVKSIAQIGTELGIDYVLEGSVRSHAGVLRLTTQLIKVSDQSHAWTESIEGDLANPLQAQISLSDQIARAIATRLFPGAPPPHFTTKPKPRPNEEAYELYRQGCAHFPGGSERDGVMGAMCLHQSVAKDPEYVHPHAMLGILYTCAALFDSGIVTDTSLPSLALQGKFFANRALELDPDCGEAHCAVAAQRFHFDWDWKSAESHFKKALELNDSFTISHLMYASALAHMGFKREARVQLESAVKLDPRSPIVNQWSGLTLYLTGDLNESIEFLEADLAVNPDYSFTNLLLADTYIAAEKPEQAIPWLRKCFLVSDGHTLANASLIRAYAKIGDRAEALTWLKTLEDATSTRSVSPYHHAMALASLDNVDQSFVLLEKAILQRSGWIPQLPIDPGFRVLHSDPRWFPLLERTSPLRPQRPS